MKEQLKTAGFLTGAILGMIGSFLMPLGLLGENGWVATIGTAFFIIGCASASLA
jgi:hypothetical protein